MRLSCLLLGVLAVAAIASTATAEDMEFYFDVRATGAEVLAPAAPFTRGQSVWAGNKKNTFAEDVLPLNGGGAGDGAVLRLSPRMPLLPEGTHGAHWIYGGKKTGWIDKSVGSAYLYVDVANKSADTEVLSSFGVDMALVKEGVAGGNPIDSVDFVYNSTPFDGTRVETIASDGAGGFTIDDVKAVKVPVSAGPIFDATDAIVVGDAQMIGQLDVVAGEWNKGDAALANSIYGLKMSVNGLLITRVYDNAAGGPTPESIAFGYLAGSPEAASADGSTVGATSTTDDLTVVVQAKGDFNNDGNVDTSDLDNTWGMEWFLNSEFGTPAEKPRQRGYYLGDFNNTDFTSTYWLDTADLGNPTGSGMEQMILACFGSCPCP